MGEFRLTSIWCIPADATDAVLVMARYSDGRMGWTHLMRWTPGRAPEAGAWARLQLSRALCRVDPTGEFLQYHAKNRFGAAQDESTPPHFRASLGGGWAISRAPWLSALTDVEGRGYLKVNGGGASVHALPPKDQRELWGKFPRPSGYWLQRQQPGWRATCAVDSHGEPLHSSSGWEGEQTAPRVPGALVVRVPGGLCPAFDVRRGPRFLWRDARGEVEPMRGVAWARLRPGGRLLWATQDGWLRSAKRREGAAAPGWESEWEVVEEHDCSVREPAPGPSPEWARARL